MDRLANTLSSLKHLNLDGHIVRKHPLQAGLGGTCDVFTAYSTKHSRKVAVKRIRVFLRKDEALMKVLSCSHPNSSSILKQSLFFFSSEIGEGNRHLAKLDHECVLPLLGYLVEGEDMMPSLVSEWMEHGTLNDFMKRFPRGGVDTWNMVSS